MIKWKSGDPRFIDYKLIGKRIKTARILKNISEKSLANMMNVSISYISRVERGDSREINLPRIYEISYYLNVSISYILDNSSYFDKNYLFKDFQSVISKLNTSKRKLLLNIAKQLDEV